MSNLISITYVPCEPTPVNGYLVKYRPISGGALRTWPVNFFPSPGELLAGEAVASFLTAEDPDGTQYSGFIYGDCGNGNLGIAEPWSTEESASASCTPVAFVEGTVPDATDGEAYSVDLHLTGTAPFALDSVTKPAWMIVTLVGSTVQLRGTPSSADTGEELTIMVSNCGGADTDTFSDTLDVNEPTSGTGNVSVQECATEATITEVRWNGLTVITESGAFPLNPGDSATVGVPGPGTHTLSVTGDIPSGMSVVVEDSLGNVGCQSVLPSGGFGTLSFPGFVITEAPWSVLLQCLGC